MIPGYGAYLRIWRVVRRYGPYLEIWLIVPGYGPLSGDMAHCPRIWSISADISRCPQIRARPEPYRENLSSYPITACNVNRILKAGLNPERGTYPRAFPSSPRHREVMTPSAQRQCRDAPGGASPRRRGGSRLTRCARGTSDVSPPTLRPAPLSPKPPLSPCLADRFCRISHPRPTSPPSLQATGNK